jgi:hypothetical protein
MDWIKAGAGDKEVTRAKSQGRETGYKKELINKTSNRKNYGVLIRNCFALGLFSITFFTAKWN